MSLSMLFAVSCEDNGIQRNAQPIGGKTLGGRDDGAGGFKQNPGETYPYPEIIEREFIPPYDLFDGVKCLTWRITWPSYDSDYDYELIPTVLSLKSGGLNSFRYLNNSAPQLTYNSIMSLYYDSKVESTNSMWSELDHSFGPEASDEMQTVYFVKGSVPLDELMDWVQIRPSRFEINWPGVGIGNYEMEYEEGDFIHFWLSDSNQYGGIRIVSMAPRIIEVYLAVEHY
jgi:hypothetical protein